MLTENQQKWLAALRSGEFSQAMGSLQDGLDYAEYATARDAWVADIQQTGDATDE